MGTLTKREAIRECKKLWKEIEESTLTKGEFVESPEGQKWVDKHYDLDCPLCEYSKQTSGAKDCRDCPLITQYDEGCYSLGFYETIKCDSEWFKAIRGLKEVKDGEV